MQKIQNSYVKNMPQRVMPRCIVSRVLRALKEFDLINDGDIVAVGVSGGKDSMLLAYALHQISQFWEKKFEVVAISLDCTNGETDYAPTKNFFKTAGIKFKLIKTNIFEVIFDVRKEKNPCSLCANLRRGRLNSEAKKLHATKIALGHHSDDFIETFFLSLFYEGRLHSFAPKTYMSRADITQIRPLFYLSEAEIEAAVKVLEIPIINNCCAANRHTQREFVKKEIARLEMQVPNFKKQILKAALQVIK